MSVASPTVELLADGNLQLTFPYSAPAVAAVKQLGRARWSDSGKHWILPYSAAAVDGIKRIFPWLVFGERIREQLGAEAQSQYDAAEAKFLPKQQDVDVSDFKFKTQPLWHQKVSFNFARRLPCSALFLEQGLGKTKIAIDLGTWRYRKGDVFRHFYVCPNTVAPNWEQDDVRQHLHDDYSRVWLLRGGTKEKAKLLEQIYHEDQPGWIVCNYDALRNLETLLVKMQGGRGGAKLFQAVDLDESSRIKHATSARSKSAYVIGRTVRFRLAMTGTPITQTAEDAFAQYRYLDDKIFGPYATAFRAQYLMMGGFENRQVVGYRNFPDFLKKLYSVAIRFTKDRCLDLPAKVYERRTATLDPETSKRYRQFEKECVAEFCGAQVTAPLVMTKIMKLSQVTGGFVYEQGADGKRVATHRFPTNPKLDVLEEVLEEVAPKKVIVWCRFTEEVKMIAHLLGRLGIGFTSIHGGVKAEDRGAAVTRFQTDPACRVFLGQVTTAGMGITLTAGKVTVYYSNTYALEERLQSEDRNHRIGQKDSVLYLDIVAETSDGKKTIDHDVLEVLRGKAAFANEVSLALMQRMVHRAEGQPETKRNPAFLKKHSKNDDSLITQGESFEG